MELKLPPGGVTTGKESSSVSFLGATGRRGVARVAKRRYRKLPKEFSTSKEILEKLTELHALPGKLKSNFILQHLNLLFWGKFLMVQLACFHTIAKNLSLTEYVITHSTCRS